jgi:glycosyltransferase involved in cell wall biosynthesis
MEPLSLVIPIFNEADTIGAVILKIPAAYRSDIIVADGCSTDGIQEIARDAGARHRRRARLRPRLRARSGSRASRPVL